MNDSIREYLEKYPSEIVDMFFILRQLIFDSTSDDTRELMWAKIPSYYVSERFVRLIPFGDHINVEAKAIADHKSELTSYKITPKGMLQLSARQDIPLDILRRIFTETLL